MGSGKKSFLKYETTGWNESRDIEPSGVPEKKEKGVGGGRRRAKGDGRSYSAPFGVPST